ncbi:MAG: hypothetical protein ACN4GR_14675 [Arenicellales bacterium]
MRREEILAIHSTFKLSHEVDGGNSAAVPAGPEVAGSECGRLLRALARRQVDLHLPPIPCTEDIGS